MQIIDGKQVASQVLEEVGKDIARLREQGITPGLAVVLVGEDPASQVYVNSKVKKCAELGMNSRKIVLSADASQEELLQVVRDLNADPSIHGILVQSPPPPHIDEAAVVLEIDPAKDVDGFHPENVGRLSLGLPGFVSCTPAGVMELCMRALAAIVLARCLGFTGASMASPAAWIGSCVPLAIAYYFTSRKLARSMKQGFPPCREEEPGAVRQAA